MKSDAAPIRLDPPALVLDNDNMQHTSPPTSGLHVSKEHLETLKLGSPVRIAVPELGADVVMVLAMPSETLEKVLEDTLEDLRVSKAWTEVVRQSLVKWVKENDS